MAEAVARRLIPTVYSREGLRGAGRGGHGGSGRRSAVHVKVDTGMHRVGADPAEVPGAGGRGRRDAGLALGAAVDPPGGGRRATAEDRAFTAAQLEPVRRRRGRAGRRRAPARRAHAANSAGAIAWPAARYDLVRCGIALYGVAPVPGAGRRARRPPPGGSGCDRSCRCKAQVASVRELDAGERPSYGRRRPLPRGRRWPPSPSATPTACPAGCSTRAARC